MLGFCDPEASFKHVNRLQTARSQIRDAFIMVYLVSISDNPKTLQDFGASKEKTMLL